MISEAKTRANVKYNQTRDSITIRPTKEEGAAIRERAAERGQSVSGYLLELARAEREKK